MLLGNYVAPMLGHAGEHQFCARKFWLLLLKPLLQMDQLGAALLKPLLPDGGLRVQRVARGVDDLAVEEDAFTQHLGACHLRRVHNAMGLGLPEGSKIPKHPREPRAGAAGPCC
jgi:hypothetical protein